MTSSHAGRGAPPRVLVTDGEFKHTLGIVRSLADAGHEVHLLARSARAPAVHSQAVHAWYPVATGGEALEARLLELTARLAPAAVIAVGSDAMAAADRLRKRWPAGAAIALPSERSFTIANHKDLTADTARSVGVDTPRSRLVSSADEARAALAEWGAPLVLKSSREEGRKVLRYARDDREAAEGFAAVRSGAADAVLAQEYVRGDGFGFCALYWHGRSVRHFMHRRVREWPPTGGASAAAESVPDAPLLEAAGTRLLDALGWHGVAMVEFKGDPFGASGGGRLALIEINAKFWGSHDIALAAGVDFPADLAALLEGRTLGPQPPVRHVRFSWPLGGDLWHGLARPAALPRVLWEAISPGVAHNGRWSDPLPHVYELMQCIRSTPGAWREARALR